MVVERLSRVKRSSCSRSSRGAWSALVSPASPTGAQGGGPRLDGHPGEAVQDLGRGERRHGQVHPGVTAVGFHPHRSLLHPKGCRAPV